METLGIVYSIAFPLAFVVILAIPFLLEICDLWQTSSWEYEDDGYKYDKIHDRRKKMNKRERIEQLEKQVRNLKKELEYVEHKNDKAKFKNYRGCENGFYTSVELVYPNHLERTIKTLGLCCVGYEVGMKIVAETDKEIYIEVPHKYEEFNTIKVVNKEDNKIKEINTQDFEALKELFETKPKKSSKKGV